MQGPVKVPESSDVSAEQRAPDELIYLIRKLRWMGMEDEAKIMEVQVAARRVQPGDNVIGGPRDTD
jgi:hypothetical protein